MPYLFLKNSERTINTCVCVYSSLALNFGCPRGPTTSHSSARPFTSKDILEGTQR